MGNGETLRVLVVDDNLAHARLVAALVGEAFPASTVLRAGRLSSALRRFDSTDVDVVLLDLFLPDAQGVATLAQVLARTIVRPVVVVTALDDGEIAAEALRRGASDVLVKDLLTPDALRRSVVRALGAPPPPRPAATAGGRVLDRAGFGAAAGPHLALAARQRLGITSLVLWPATAGAGGAPSPADVAEATAAAVRGSDVVGRVSDDHVAALLAGDATAAAAPLERIAARLARASQGEAHVESEVRHFEPGEAIDLDDVLPAADARVLRPHRTRIVSALAVDQQDRPELALEPASFDVVAARSTDELLRLAALDDTDVVVIAASPAAAAADVLRALSAQPETSDVPVVTVGAPGAIPGSGAVEVADGELLAPAVAEALARRRR